MQLGLSDRVANPPCSDPAQLIIIPIFPLQPLCVDFTVDWVVSILREGQKVNFSAAATTHPHPHPQLLPGQQIRPAVFSETQLLLLSQQGACSAPLRQVLLRLRQPDPTCLELHRLLRPAAAASSPVQDPQQHKPQLLVSSVAQPLALAPAPLKAQRAVFSAAAHPQLKPSPSRRLVSVASVDQRLAPRQPVQACCKLKCSRRWFHRMSRVPNFSQWRSEHPAAATAAREAHPISIRSNQHARTITTAPAEHRHQHRHPRRQSRCQQPSTDHQVRELCRRNSQSDRGYRQTHFEPNENVP